MRAVPLGLCALVLALAGARVAIAAPASAPAASSQWVSVTLPAAQQLDVPSAKTGLRYRIFVSVPENPVPPDGYPVFYVLDGNAAFPVAAFLARSAAARSKVTGHVAPLVVGIGYAGKDDFHVDERKRDYTVGSGATPASEGGAARFFDFIESELKPLIATRYPVDPKRQALFGHSFGGLFVLNTLFTQPRSFSTFVASSPSIWWKDKLVLKDLPEFEKVDPAQRPRVQISVGALEDDPPKGNYPPQMRAMLASRPMVSEARRLAAQLQGLPQGQDKVVFYELAGENHGPAWLPAMTRGMQFFLEQP